MQKKNDFRIYLDTCVYLALFEDDRTLSEKYDDILGGAIDNQEVTLITSSILNEEIIESKTLEEHFEIISSMIDNSRSHRVDEGRMALIEAHKLVERSKQANKISMQAREKQQPTILKYEDARHLQCAIYAEADEFHTIDEGIIKINHKFVTQNNKIRIIRPEESVLLKNLLI